MMSKKNCQDILRTK